jgi:serine/threonine protein kinase
MSEFQIGRFQVVGTLGTGAHSTILHVRRSADGKNYALKVVPLEDPEDEKYLVQARHEFRVARTFDHPHLIKVYALETPKNWLFRVRKAHLLIEYVNGKTLDACPPLSLPRLVQVFERVANGLVHMHRRNVYHADLKPNNILVGRGGIVKVIDFGLARIQGEPVDRVQGTPEYMAPEQSTHKVANERTDVYNLGAAMYRMVTFRLPPSTVLPAGALPLDETQWERLLKPVREFSPAAPRELCDLIERCLAFDSRKRPARMSEVQGALDHLTEKLVKGPDERLETLDY